MITRLNYLSEKFRREIYGYLGFCNLTGSIKDKPALMMVEDLKKKGIQKDRWIIEGTAGNTGTGLAWYCKQAGYKFIAVVPDKVSPEKIEKLKGVCEKVFVCPTVSKEHPDFYLKKCADLANELDGIYIDQFNNLSNIRAHECYTAPDIHRYFGQQPDVIFCGIGTGGTLKGLSNYFSKLPGKTDFIVGDPQGSIYHKTINCTLLSTEHFAIEGIGSSYITPFFDNNIVKKAYAINDHDAYLACRDFYKNEGICCGGSSGVQLMALTEYCCDTTIKSKAGKIVLMLPDHGGNYIEKIYKEETCI